MGRQRVQRGHAKQFITPVRARNIIGGASPGIAGTREQAKVAKNASIPGNFKSPGVNGVGFHDPLPCSYHSNAGMGGRKK
jgi:hypothetical protein